MLELYVSLVNRLEDLREGERGQTMAEYAVILGVITAIVIAAILALSGGITGRLNEITAIL
jgi:Flp pilus assembly pilin Flp